MLKTLGQFEVEIAGKIGRFLLDHDTQINHAKDMCLEFLKILGKIEDAAKAHEEQVKSEKAQSEETPQVENV